MVLVQDRSRLRWPGQMRAAATCASRSELPRPRRPSACSRASWCRQLVHPAHRKRTGGSARSCNLDARRLVSKEHLSLVSMERLHKSSIHTSIFRRPVQIHSAKVASSADPSCSLVQALVLQQNRHVSPCRMHSHLQVAFFKRSG